MTVLQGGCGVFKFSNYSNIQFCVFISAEDGLELSKIQKVKVLRNDRRQG